MIARLLPWFLFALNGVCCNADNLRASREETIRVSDDDLLSIGSYMVIAVDGYELKDLEMSTETQAILECAVHMAFDQVHGDHDGLYLAGQQILATTHGDENTHETFLEKKPSRRDLPYHIRMRPWDHPDIRKVPKPKKDDGKTLVDKVSWMDVYAYWHGSGRCNMCPDDDASVTYESLLLDSESKQRAALKIARDQQIASDYIQDETSLNAIADALLATLILGNCTAEGDDTLTYVQHADIFTLTQEDFETSLATIERRQQDDISFATEDLLPFYHNSGNRFFKIGISGVDCGPWKNQDLFDLNAALHDSINALKQLQDKGHVVDKIVGGRYTPKGRRFSWKCKYDIYSKIDVEGKMDDYALDDIGESLCAKLSLSGGSKFQNAIDCFLSPLSANDYKSAIGRQIPTQME